MSEPQLTLIPIDLLAFSGKNPRTEMRGLEEFAENIKEYGILEPIIVRPKEDKFEIIVGERRVRASLIAGLKEIPAIIRGLTDSQADELRLIENIHREDLIDAEKGDAIYLLLENYPEKYPTIKSVATQLGKPEDAVRLWTSKARRLSEYVKQLVSPGFKSGIGEDAVKRLLKYDHQTQGQLAKVILDHQLKEREYIQFLKLYDENPSSNLDLLAREVKGIKEVKISIEELPEKARRDAEQILARKKIEIEKGRQESQKKAVEESRKTRNAWVERKKKARERLQQKKTKPEISLLPEEKVRLENVTGREIGKIVRERERKGEFMQATVELEERREFITSSEHSIIIGDGRIVLKQFPDSCVDLVVTSPPYFNLKDYPENPLGINTQTIEGYLRDMKEVFSECFRVLKDGRFFCIIIGQFTSEESSYFIPAYIVQLLESIGFRYKREHIWVKPLGIQGIWNRGTTSFLKNPFPRNTMINIHHEHILIFQKGDKPAIFYGRNPLTEDEVKGYCWSVWELQVSGTKDHPAPFPDAIPERLIKMYSYEGEVILDPFLGSGTCTKMAKNLKRHSIGIEVNAQYLPLIYLTVGDARIIRYDKGETIDSNGFKTLISSEG